MTDCDFQSWMRRVAAEPAASPAPDSDVIWWRAQLRHRMADHNRVTRPLRIAERAAGVLCFAAAVAAGARLGSVGLVPFIAVTLVAAAGAAAIVLRGAAD